MHRVHGRLGWRKTKGMSPLLCLSNNLSSSNVQQLQEHYTPENTSRDLRSLVSWKSVSTDFSEHRKSSKWSDVKQLLRTFCWQIPAAPRIFYSECPTTLRRFYVRPSHRSFSIVSTTIIPLPRKQSNGSKHLKFMSLPK